MMKRVKSDEEVSLEYMKIYERERMLKAQGLEQGLEQGYAKGMKEEAEKNARTFFENGADFELVKNSIKTLSEEVLQAIYREVKNSNK